MQKKLVSRNFYTKATHNQKFTKIFGYASVFDVKDHDKDIIRKGAFTDSLSFENQQAIKFLWQHNAAMPIGKIVSLEEDEYGLKIEAEINNETEKGREASSLLKQKAVDSLSIGFHIKDHNITNDGEREITKAHLVEVSIVTFPANAKAQINSVKARAIETAPVNICNKISQLLVKTKSIK